MGSEVRVPRMLRIKEVAKLTGIEPWRWYEMLKRGDGPPHMKIGNTIRISDAALTAWIEQRQMQKVVEP